MPLYMFPAVESDAPAGSIIISNTDRAEDGAVLISVDPHGVAMKDAEAALLAAEICRRWNAGNL